MPEPLSLAFTDRAVFLVTQTCDESYSKLRAKPVEKAAS